MSPFKYLQQRVYIYQMYLGRKNKRPETAKLLYGNVVEACRLVVEDYDEVHS